jgi:hypothetical protein
MSLREVVVVPRFSFVIVARWITLPTCKRKGREGEKVRRERKEKKHRRRAEEKRERKGKRRDKRSGKEERRE